MPLHYWFSLLFIISLAIAIRFWYYIFIFDIYATLLLITAFADIIAYWLPLHYAITPLILILAFILMSLMPCHCYITHYHYSFSLLIADRHAIPLIFRCWYCRCHHNISDDIIFIIAILILFRLFRLSLLHYYISYYWLLLLPLIFFDIDCRHAIICRRHYSLRLYAMTLLILLSLLILPHYAIISYYWPFDIIISLLLRHYFDGLLIAD